MKKKKNVSALDVAKRCGVSRTTVSFVLNNAPGKKISEETRQKVLKAVKELNYKPNTQARNLAMTRHYSIGVFICHSQSVFSDAFIPRVIEGIAQKLNRYRIQLIVQPVKLKQSNYFSIAKEESIDGIILMNTHDEDEGLRELLERKFPVVVIGAVSDPRVVQVDIDNRESAKKAVDYLVELGHRRIGIITHASTVYYAARDRLNGYYDALRDAGIEIDESLIKYGNFTEESGYNSAAELLDLPEPPQAIFAGNDVIAYGAIKAIKDRGLSIPEDISIVGFDDDYLSRYLNPPLTTVSVPASGLGSEAAMVLMKIISGKMKSGGRRIILPAYFSERGSCRQVEERSKKESEEKEEKSKGKSTEDRSVE